MSDVIAPETRFAEILGPEHVLTGARLEGRDRGRCDRSLDCGLLLRPADAAELSQVVRAAAEMGVSLVPHGGLTGLVQGVVSAPGQAAVSFERMTRIEEIDVAQGAVTAGAGVTLQQLDEALAPHGAMIGVDIPSRGSCTLGGVISTNAGGVKVLRYGMTRQNLLGLEAVLADGRILDLASPLAKDNAGYDLSQLFIGSEGTLGLVTKAVFRLWPRPRALTCALVACESYARAAELLVRARAELGSALQSFEAMWPDYYRLTTSQAGFGALPLPPDHGAYAIVEAEGETDDAAQEALLGLLGPAFEEGLVIDAAVASSEAERARIWRTREDSWAVHRTYGAHATYDIGLRVADLDPFAKTVAARFKARIPQATPYFFGHVGDGNLHVVVGAPPEILADREAADALVYGAVAEFSHGTISAEHAVGLEKRAWLGRTLPAERIAVMKTMKAALDPGNLLNPGKIFEM